MTTRKLLVTSKRIEKVRPCGFAGLCNVLIPAHKATCEHHAEAYRRVRATLKGWAPQ